ncbi:MerR family transcriptional regulator [Microbacterium sp. GXF0217]
MSHTLTPHAAATRAGVSLDTLRYYEREGLIGPIQRTAGGRRVYGEDDQFWIGLVTCLRDAGLGISELRAFTTLLRGEGDASDRVAFLRHHRSELQERIARIELAIGVLDDKIAYYAERVDG